MNDDHYDPHEGIGLIAFGCGCVCMLVVILLLKALA